MQAIPTSRVQVRNDAPVRSQEAWVLYWMIASRRAHWNFALDHAIAWAKELDRPLLIVEALRADYPWSSERFHQFVLEGMADNAQAFAKTPAHYHAYVEREPNEGKAMLGKLASRSCVVITDDFPAYFLPRMVNAVASQILVRFETVDSNGLLPIRIPNSDFPTAYAFRRFLQKSLPPHLRDMPSAEPFKGVTLPRLPSLPRVIEERWPAPASDVQQWSRLDLSRFATDHSVRPVEYSGGSVAATTRLRTFLSRTLSHYAEHRNHPDERAVSGLSPYLHFGHLSSHQVFSELMAKEEWNLTRLSKTTTGKKEGWWGTSEAAEAFLDQLVTWRELGFNTCFYRPDYETFESLPSWALATLRKHARDKRKWTYSIEELEQARTHDHVWNAAQCELVLEGRIHNYMRMLWGKKILEWSPTPEEALHTLIHLNNKYSVDGRDPNSYSGIFWVLGRYDRPFGPERPIFGNIRYMSSENTVRKLHVREYLGKYNPRPTQLRLDGPDAMED